MNLSDYLHVLRKQWVLITVITLLAIGGATAASVLSPRVFQAQTQTFVAIASQDSSAGQILSGSQFTLQRVKSYTQIVNSPRVLDPVIAELGLATSSSELAKHVTADSPLDTVLININVTDGSAEQAALIQIAKAAAEPGLSVDEVLRRTDAVIRLDKKIRSAQRKLGRKQPYPEQVVPAERPVPLDERLKAHFVDGGNSVH